MRQTLARLGLGLPCMAETPQSTLQHAKVKKHRQLRGNLATSHPVREKNDLLPRRDSDKVRVVHQEAHQRHFRAVQVRSGQISGYYKRLLASADHTGSARRSDHTGEL